MGVTRASRHVWPYNIDFALRATLANVHRNERGLDLSTLEALTKALDWRMINSEDDTLGDVPGTFASQTLDKTSLKDPYAFPDDSAVYSTWKTMNAAIPIVNESNTHLELQTRQLVGKNLQLTEQINRIGRLAFVQNGFIEKFKLINDPSR